MMSSGMATPKRTASLPRQSAGAPLRAVVSEKRVKRAAVVEQEVVVVAALVLVGEDTGLERTYPHTPPGERLPMRQF
jgi:hypothetical protein